MTPDAELLSRYANQHDEPAFAELVNRHLDHVYSTARRLVGGDAHLAEDVAQQVFTCLARQARSLQKHSALGGWLHTTARFTAAKIVRSEQRRRRREEATMITSETSSTPEWEQVCSFLDESIGELNAADRDALILRYFEKRPFGQIGEVLGLTENAARMRVERALDKLRTRLSSKGITSSAAALGAILVQNVVEAAPAALGSRIVTGALQGITAGSAASSWFLTTAGRISMTTLAILMVGTALLLLAPKPEPAPPPEMPRAQSANPAPQTQPPATEIVAPAAPAINPPAVPPAMEQQLQAAFEQFPLVTPQVSSSGKPAFQHFPLRNPVEINGTNYYGFRFKVPARANREDFVWAFVNPAERMWSGLLPPTGGHLHFQSSVSTYKNDYLTTQGLAPMRRISLILKNVSGGDLKDDATYLVWFRFSNLAVQEMPVAIAFTNVPSSTTNDRLAALESAMSLDRDITPPIVNPDNGHQYILLKAATWKESREQAQAMGGHLATVRNQAENDWLVKTFGSYGGVQRLLWIGLNDTEKKFHFGWNSGESASYTHWADGEPNNAGRGETFVAIYYPGHSQGGKWNDWNDRDYDPIGLPMNAVVEIIPKNQALAAGADARSSSTDPSGRTSQPGREITVGRDATGELTAVEIHPELVISSESGSIKLQWSIDAADHMLEATTDLARPFTMFGYSEATNFAAGVVYVTITNPVPQMYFRLVRPPPTAAPQLR